MLWISIMITDRHVHLIKTRQDQVRNVMPAEMDFDKMLHLSSIVKQNADVMDSFNFNYVAWVEIISIKISWKCCCIE